MADSPANILIDKIFEYVPEVERTLKKVETLTDQAGINQDIKKAANTAERNQRVFRHATHITNDRLLDGIRKSIDRGIKNLNVSVDTSAYPGVSRAIYKMTNGRQNNLINADLFERANTFLTNVATLHMGLDPVQAVFSEMKDGELQVPILETPNNGKGLMGGTDCEQASEPDYIVMKTDADGNFETQDGESAIDKNLFDQSINLRNVAWDVLKGLVFNWLADQLGRIKIWPLKPVIGKWIRDLRALAERCKMANAGIIPPVKPPDPRDRGVCISVTGLWNWHKVGNVYESGEATSKEFWDGEKKIENGSWTPDPKVDTEGKTIDGQSVYNDVLDSLMKTGVSDDLQIVKCTLDLDPSVATTGNLPRLIDIPDPIRSGSSGSPQLGCADAAQSVIMHTLKYADKVENGAIKDNTINPRAIKYRTQLDSLENLTEAMKYSDKATAKEDDPTIELMNEGSKKVSPTVQFRWSKGPAKAHADRVKSKLVKREVIA